MSCDICLLHIWETNYWKARAQAYEGIIRRNRVFKEKPCVICQVQVLDNENDKREACSSCGYGYSNFNFDQERFSDKSIIKQED